MHANQLGSRILSRIGQGYIDHETFGVPAPCIWIDCINNDDDQSISDWVESLNAYVFAFRGSYPWIQAKDISISAQ